MLTALDLKEWRILERRDKVEFLLLGIHLINFIFTLHFMQGTIKKLTDKNFGFIAQEGADDLFFHANNLDGISFDQLREGDAVTFEVEKTEKGNAAVNVKKA